MNQLRLDPRFEKNLCQAQVERLMRGGWRFFESESARDYQARALHRTLADWRDGYYAGRIDGAVRSGKASLYMSLGEMIVRNGGRVLILTSGNAEQNEVLKRYEKSRQQALKQGERGAFTPEQIFTVQKSGQFEQFKKSQAAWSVVTAQFANWKGRVTELDPDQFDLIIVEECHDFFGNSFIQTLEHFNGLMVLGSAFPHTVQNHWSQYIPHVYDEITPEELIQNHGYPRPVYMPPQYINDMTTLYQPRVSASGEIDFNDTRTHDQLNLGQRFIAMRDIMHYVLSLQEQFMAAFPTIEDMKLFQQLVIDIDPQLAGKIDWIGHERGKKLNQEIIEAHKHGEIFGINSVRMGFQAVNSNNTRHLIVATVIRSLSLLGQFIGRGAGKAEGKKEFYIHDLTSSILHATTGSVRRRALKAVEVPAAQAQIKKIYPSTKISRPEFDDPVTLPPVNISQFEGIGTTVNIPQLNFLEDPERAVGFFKNYCEQVLQGISPHELMQNWDRYAPSPQTLMVDNQGQEIPVTLAEARSAAEYLKTWEHCRQYDYRAEILEQLQAVRAKTAQAIAPKKSSTEVTKNESAEEAERAGDTSALDLAHKRWQEYIETGNYLHGQPLGAYYIRRQDFDTAKTFFEVERGRSFDECLQSEALFGHVSASEIESRGLSNVKEPGSKSFFSDGYNLLIANLAKKIGNKSVSQRAFSLINITRLLSGGATDYTAFMLRQALEEDLELDYFAVHILRSVLAKSVATVAYELLNWGVSQKTVADLVEERLSQSDLKSAKVEMLTCLADIGLWERASDLMEKYDLGKNGPKRFAKHLRVIRNLPGRDKAVADFSSLGVVRFLCSLIVTNQVTDKEQLCAHFGIVKTATALVTIYKKAKRRENEFLIKQLEPFIRDMTSVISAKGKLLIELANIYGRFQEWDRFEALAKRGADYVENQGSKTPTFSEIEFLTYLQEYRDQKSDKLTPVETQVDITEKDPVEVQTPKHLVKYFLAQIKNDSHKAEAVTTVGTHLSRRGKFEQERFDWGLDALGQSLRASSKFKRFVLDMAMSLDPQGNKATLKYLLSIMTHEQRYFPVEILILTLRMGDIIRAQSLLLQLPQKIKVPGISGENLPMLTRELVKNKLNQEAFNLLAKIPDPESLIACISFGHSLYLAGDLDRGKMLLRRAMEIPFGTYKDSIAQSLVEALAEARMDQEALEVDEKLKQISRTQTLKNPGAKAIALVQMQSYLDHNDYETVKIELEHLPPAIRINDKVELMMLEDMLIKKLNATKVSEQIERILERYKNQRVVTQAFDLLIKYKRVGLARKYSDFSSLSIKGYWGTRLVSEIETMLAPETALENLRKLERAEMKKKEGYSMTIPEAAFLNRLTLIATGYAKLNQSRDFVRLAGWVEGWVGRCNLPSQEDLVCKALIEMYLAWDKFNSQMNEEDQVSKPSDQTDTVYFVPTRSCLRDPQNLKSEILTKYPLPEPVEKQSLAKLKTNWESSARNNGLNLKGTIAAYIYRHRSIYESGDDEILDYLTDQDFTKVSVFKGPQEISKAILVLGNVDKALDYLEGIIQSPMFEEASSFDKERVLDALIDMTEVGGKRAEALLIRVSNQLKIRASTRCYKKLKKLHDLQKPDLIAILVKPNQFEPDSRYEKANVVKFLVSYGYWELANDLLGTINSDPVLKTILTFLATSDEPKAKKLMNRAQIKPEAILKSVQDPQNQFAPLMLARLYLFQPDIYEQVFSQDDSNYIRANYFLKTVEGLSEIGESKRVRELLVKAEKEIFESKRGKWELEALIKVVKSYFKLGFTADGTRIIAKVWEDGEKSFGDRQSNLIKETRELLVGSHA